MDPKLVDYARIASLGTALDRLMSVVPAGDLHVIRFDDLVREPAAVYAALVDFLGISNRYSPVFDRHNASAKGPRYPALRRLTHRPPKALAAPMRRLRQYSRTTDSALVARVKSPMWQSAPRPVVTAETREEVAAYLQDDQALLAQLLESNPSPLAVRQPANGAPHRSESD